jgi:hypothetical protein
MSAEDVKPRRVEMTLENHFQEEINKEANWRYSLSTTHYEFAGTIYGETYDYRVLREHGVRDHHVKTSLATATAEAIVYFQGVIRDNKPEEVEETVVESVPVEVAEVKEEAPVEPPKKRRGRPAKVTVDT